ncbi:MAG TPA: hypothetical protein VKV21_04055 [Solirubrobacteraceae bacterium]|nr:hypothetical protein [Solirubrobacteraceae bacterium]
MNPAVVRARRSRRLATLAVAAALAPALAGCGAPPPQPPLKDANLIDSATSGISTACGQAYVLGAFGGSHPAGMAALEASASASVAKLVLVAHRNPRWIYLGSSVRQIVAESASMLDACGLRRARTRLLRDTRRG